MSNENDFIGKLVNETFTNEEAFEDESSNVVSLKDYFDSYTKASEKTHTHGHHQEEIFYSIDVEIFKTFFRFYLDKRTIDVPKGLYYFDESILSEPRSFEEQALIKIECPEFSQVLSLICSKDVEWMRLKKEESGLFIELLSQKESALYDEVLKSA